MLDVGLELIWRECCRKIIRHGYSSVNFCRNFLFLNFMVQYCQLNSNPLRRGHRYYHTFGSLHAKPNTITVNNGSRGKISSKYLVFEKCFITFIFFQDVFYYFYFLRKNSTNINITLNRLEYKKDCNCEFRITFLLPLSHIYLSWY